MGKKARTAGSTKNRVRTCDKVKPENSYHKMLKMAKVAGCKVSSRAKSEGKQLINEHINFINWEQEITGEYRNTNRGHIQQVINKKDIINGRFD